MATVTSRDYLVELNNYCRSHSLVPVWSTSEPEPAIGPFRKAEHTVDLIISGEIVASGTGTTRNKAKQAAAYNYLSTPVHGS
ncbi:uncharacterized protein STEHIDRAFT_131784 [Stereum hirsutum FP-91666 SS1]|uniref:uncharacterized protein n=1 Tax=Stereum hirsutum (strain FP-91666) TaxID=721885 RepID=UPI000444A918|nr:uncharacterized protein STEHIDRAFT_131784 [Stereum hirsutum FP-91666 SS1]EIM86169.1 hypothetical protein STEHIDRAFT_131784 [Stereum hirsutum FP-91666 SS1]